MNRRNWIQLGAAVGASTLIGGSAMAASASNFSILEVSATALQVAMQAGKVSSKQLVQAYLARIKAPGFAKSASAA